MGEEHVPMLQAVSSCWSCRDAWRWGRTGAADGEPVVLVLLLAGATVPPVEAEEMRSALGSGCHGRVPARTVALLAHQFAHAQHVAHRRAWRSRARGGTLLAKRIIWFVSTRYIC